jgi:diguanylate cyclase (GGDEF)-like protein
VRYDGYEFRVYRSNPDDPKTLGGNYVRALLAASDGRLWVGTFSGGLSVSDPRTETFTRFDHTQLSYDRVEGLAEDRGGRIWIATPAGLDRLDPRTRGVEHFRHDARDPRSILDNRVRGLLVDRGGRLWVGSFDGLQRASADGRGFERVAPELAGVNVLRLFEDRDGRIWIGTEKDGAAVFDPRDGSLHRFRPQPEEPNGLSHFWAYGFAEAAPGEMWIATFGGGVDVVDEKSLAIIDRLKHDPTLNDTIGADRVGAVFRDRSGLVWVGTWGEGIARHDPRTRAFRSLRFSPSHADGLTHPAAVRAMEMRDGTIWVGTNGNGIDVLDRSLRRVGGYRADGTPGALSDGGITCLGQSDNGTIWVATLDGSLHRLLPGAKRFDRLPPERLAGGQIRTIAFTKDGLVWTGAAHGMARIDPVTLETHVIREWPGAPTSPAIESIAVAANGTMWVGSDNGLYAFDPRTETSVRIAKDRSRRDGLPDNWVPDLMIARDGRLWAGTAGGVCVLTHWDGRIARFRVLAPTPAEALIEDDQGFVWVGPRLRIDPRTWTSRELGPSDGVAFRTFFIASRAKTRDGALLFGSPEGLLVVDPRAVTSAWPEQPVVATALRVEGRARAGAGVRPTLALSASERTFTLDVAALDFAGVPRQVYRHRLEGLDTGWTVMGASQHSFTYSRLPPGHYTLHVGVTNRDGRWSSRELQLPVDVEPAMYQTPWFRALAAAIALAQLYGAYRLRVRQLHARERELERLVSERTRELEVAYERIEQASLTDPLTKLRNRRFLDQTIAAVLALASRGQGDLVLLLADLDHFKSVNDTYGHAAGDAVLVQLAEILQSTFRASDHIVRWGGEEFLVIVRFVDRARASELAEKLRASVASHAFTLADGTILHRTCSIGFASWPASHPLSWERVIDLADAALYAAKRNGRDACVGAETLVA